MNVRRDFRGAGRRRRGGMVLVWVALCLVVLLSFVALGIDGGRMYLVRTELQIAADAAARTAIWPVPELRFADGATRAQSAIDGNDAGGGAIGYLEDSDLAYGLWSRTNETFTELPQARLAESNAARVRTHRSSAYENPMPTTFAQIMGVDSVDVDASAIAMIRGGWKYRGFGFGIVGLDYVSTNGTTRTDSYNPEEGPYDPNDFNDGGTIATNGNITLVGTTDIYGDARYGPDWDTSPETDYISKNQNSDVTGWQAPLDAPLVYPPATAPASWDNSPLQSVTVTTTTGSADKPTTTTSVQSIIDANRNVGMNGKKAITIQGGTEANPAVFYVNNFEIDGNQNVTINGFVKIFATGNVKLVGNTDVHGADGSITQPFPKNLEVNVIGSGTVDIGGGSKLYARVYAPESPITIHGTSGESGLFGSVIGKSIDILGNSAIHFDESTDFGGNPEMDELFVELVR